MADPTIWTWVVPATSGGLAGAVVTSLFNYWKMRLDLALAQIREFIPKFAELAGVLGLLGLKRPLVADELNRVIAMGDWMDSVAYLYLKRFLDAGLVEDLGLVRQIKRFRERVADAVPVTPALGGALQNWKHMADVSR